jgi:hypothetical protein
MCSLESGQLSLLLGFLLLRIFSDILAALVVLDVLIVDSQSLVNLRAKSRFVLNAMAKLVIRYM